MIKLKSLLGASESKEVRCRNCNAFLFKIKGEDWSVEIKCRRCSLLGRYSSTKKELIADAPPTGVLTRE